MENMKPKFPQASPFVWINGDVLCYFYVKNGAADYIPFSNTQIIIKIKGIQQLVSSLD